MNMRDRTIAIHLEDGTEIRPDGLAEPELMRIGEAIIFQGDPAIYRVTDVQHQLRRDFPKSGRTGYILTNVIVAPENSP